MKYLKPISAEFYILNEESKEVCKLHCSFFDHTYHLSFFKKRRFGETWENKKEIVSGEEFEKLKEFVSLTL